MPELLVGPLFMYEIPDEYKVLVTDLDCQIVNGEYLDSSFIFDKDLFELYSDSVIDTETNTYYNFARVKDKIIVENIDRKSMTLQFPKLYYKGYRLVDEQGNSYKVYKGVSQFCTAVVNQPQGKLQLRYCHPVWLKVLWLLTFSSFIILLSNKKVRKILN